MPPPLLKCLHDLESKIVLADVGGADGLPHRWMSLAKSLEVISFEPDPRSYESLARCNPGTSMHTVNSALASRAGSLKLHLTRKPQLSSVYLPNTELLKAFDDPQRWDVVGEVDVDAITMDEALLGLPVDVVDALKLDTQGSELDILHGAIQTLASVLAIEVEVEFLEIYAGQPLFCDVDGFLRANGFRLVKLATISWRRTGVERLGSAGGEVAFADATYMRDPATLHPPLDAERARKAIMLASLYGVDEYALYLLDRSDDLIEEAGECRAELIDRNRRSVRNMVSRNVARGRRSGEVRLRRLLTPAPR